jgi:hypothetical protein
MKKEMGNFQKNQKDKHLLVGAILLISVMVVVSVVVNAWAGKTSQVPQVEELNVSSVTFSSGNAISVVVENNGTVSSVITEMWINDQKQTFTVNSTDGLIPPKDSASISMLYTYSNSTNYHFKMASERGTIQLFTATAP